MASSVHFKFKSQKEPTRVPFDGTGISVFDLKREIISMHRLGDGTDFELAIYNESTNEEYEDDTTIIPRSTSVIAKRLPARQPGKGGAARYVSGKAPVNAKTQSRQDAALAKFKASKATATSDMVNAQTEEDRMAAFLNLKDEQWKEKQQEMANQKPVFSNYKGGKRANVPEGEPPKTYVCYRCMQKGHWIQACPTNDDPNWESQMRIRRTTGIPKTFLTKVDKPDLLKGNTDGSKLQGLMVNADGDFVIAHSDEKTWKQFQENAKASAAAQKAAAVDNKELQDRGLECPIDKTLFVDPMKTPCCGKTYCENCITNALIENDLVCPGCQTENVLLDDLTEDEEVRRKIKEYEVEKAKVKQEKGDTATPNGITSSQPNGMKTEPGSKSPASSNGDNSKKRTADQADSAPAMKRQRSNDANVTSTIAQPISQIPPNLPFTSIPPDFSNMATTANGLPNMGGFASLPFMPMPGGMPNMPNMNMGMNMSWMNPIMNPMMMSNGQQFNGTGGGWNNGMPFMNGRSNNGFANGMMPNSNNNMYNSHQPNRHQPHFQNQTQNQNRPNAPAGLNRPPPSGPAAMQNKFSNQQRYLGKEEDQPYQRQALNPARQRHRVNKTREKDFKEL